MTTPWPHPPLVQRLARGVERFAVTGATGWFGRTTLELLGLALGPHAFRQRVDAYASRPHTVTVVGVGDVAVRPLDQLASADVLIHYAYLTPDRLAGMGAAAFAAANLAITTRIRAALEDGRYRALLTTSSGAAREPDFDLNPYGALKRLDELVLPGAVDGPALVIRVFNASGPHMSDPARYALGDLILQARADRPLTLTASGEVIRSYCLVADIVQVALAELLDGGSGQVETAGEQEVEIEDLAGEVRRALGREGLPIERRRDPEAPPDRYVGDGRRLRELAHRHGLALTSLRDQIRLTAGGLEP